MLSYSGSGYGAHPVAVRMDEQRPDLVNEVDQCRRGLPAKRPDPYSPILLRLSIHVNLPHKEFFLSG
jgi:hypothetical protein